MAWYFLIAAGLMEIVGVIGIKRIAQKNDVINNVILIGGFVVSFQLLLQALETIPLSTAYAVWTGIGTVGGAIVGMLFSANQSRCCGCSASLASSCASWC